MYIENTNDNPSVAIIWLHGLGASASDMQMLAEQLPKKDYGIRHIFLEAPVRTVTINQGMAMQAWYDITGQELVAREDKEGITQSAQYIESAIHTAVKSGITQERVFLSGFSQGGAMAWYTGLQQTKIGGIIALSAYLPLRFHITPMTSGKTPFFISYGKFDSVVLPIWSQTSIKWLKDKGYHNITEKAYAREHSVTFEELDDLGKWLDLQVNTGESSV